MRILTICFLITLSVGAAYAQVDSTNQTAPRVLVETKDGSQYVGRLIKQDKDRVILRTESVGVLEVMLQDVANIQFIGNGAIERGSQRRASQYFDNPNPYRYLFFPSAFTIERGEPLYQNTYLFLNSIGIGLTDNFSVSGGFEFISALAGSPILYIAPKVYVPVSDNFRLGLGAFYLNGVGETNFGGVGAGYLMGTIGDQNRNTTIGLGYAFINEEGVQAPLVTLSGMLRVSRRLALLTENWLLPGAEEAASVSLGFRIMGESIAGDIAFITIPGLLSDGYFAAIPYISLAVKL